MPTVERIGGTEIRPAARRGRSAGGFTLDCTVAQRAGASCPAGAPAAAGLFALQEDSGETPRDRAARRRGGAVLAALSALQAGVLAGDPSAGAGHLAELLDDVPAPETPALATALGAVLLRARIELLRHGR
jgi:hypothetical protein